MAEYYADKTVAALFDNPGPNLRYTFFFPPEDDSNRKKGEQHDRNMERLRSATHEGLSMEYTRLKGWGIRATRKFFCGDLVLRYCGSLVSDAKGREIEKRLKKEGVDDSFLFFFKWNSKYLCLDATADDGSYGRTVNHSRLRPNCESAGFMDGRTEAVALVALRDIMSGEEIFYDYGELSPDVIEQNPWLVES